MALETPGCQNTSVCYTFWGNRVVWPLSLLTELRMVSIQNRLSPLSIQLQSILEYNSLNEEIHRDHLDKVPVKMPSQTNMYSQ